MSLESSLMMIADEHAPMCVASGKNNREGIICQGFEHVRNKQEIIP